MLNFFITTLIKMYPSLKQNRSLGMLSFFYLVTLVLGHSRALEILNFNNKMKRQAEMKDAPILAIYIRNFAYVYNGLDSHGFT